jgi:ABC-type antimicrobial peptide transport system permease subunit
MKETKGKLPSALIKALERHFIYDKDQDTHLRNIPFFIKNIINTLYSQYKDYYILKRFTGFLLGYIFEITQGEYVIIIPCSKLERSEILFLIKDSLEQVPIYSFTVIFPGEESISNIIKINIAKTFK